jgi:magnesium-transporting ATPase (P-type)
MEQREGKIFNLKPELTTAMKLAASFAITYYGLLFIFEIITVIFRRYYIDSYYFNESQASEGTSEFITQIIQLILSTILVFSLIQIFRKKNNGKALFVGASLLLIIFQLITTGFVPWMKYALEVLLVIIIAPIRVKKKIKAKDVSKDQAPATTDQQPITT